MTELYVSLTMDSVDKVCEVKGIPIGKFWDWLGNIKFKEDAGNLTPERAEEIRRNIDQLIAEYVSTYVESRE